MEKLDGKVAFVTGASKGIGAATSKLMGSLGIKTVLAARSSSEIETLADEIRNAGGEALAIACDVADVASVRNAIAETIDTFGQIDFLVNNAGLLEPIGHLTEVSPDDWGKVIDVNVKGVFNAMHYALPHMEKAGTGVIVNISSGAAYSILEGWSHYCASKAAALMLTRAGHEEYAEKGIRVVGLSPGTVATDMQKTIKSSGINPVSTLEWSDHIPPLWVAKAICWLLTDDAKEFDGADVSLRDEAIRRRAGLTSN